MKFEEKWPWGYRGEVVPMCEWMDGRMTDDGRQVVTIAHPEPSSVELIMSLQ